MSVLVIDVGTSGLRAAIVTKESTVESVVYEEFAPNSPAPGLVEFDARAMADAVLRVANTVLSSHPVVSSVGITNQRASTIVWRRSTGEPLGPALGWQDLRTVGECIMAKATHGLSLAPNQTATKAAWMLANYVTDDSLRASDDLCIGTVDAWITWVLTRGASFVTDHTNAGVTGLTTPDASTWRQETLDALALSRHQLPAIVPTCSYVGDATALRGAPPIHALAGDQQASLVGQGCISTGLAKITFGTGGMLDVFTGTRAPDRAERAGHGTFPIVAYSTDAEINYGSEAVMLSAGTNIEWLRDDMKLVDSAADTHEIASTVPGTDGVVYVPALLGLGTPYWDYGARGTLLGITRGTTRAHVVRAVLEGVAHRGADLVQAAERDSGVSIEELRIDGGMSRNPTFVQALADCSNRTVRVSPVTEATTLGAGFLAGVAAGVWSSLEDAAHAVVPAVTVHPSGPPGISRQVWGEATERARRWIPDLSALDF